METIYQKLVEAWNRELNTSDLQTLSEDFYSNVREYLNDLKKNLEQEGPSSIEGLLRGREFERARFLFNDLIRRRALKIFKSLILGELSFETSKLTVEERDAIKYLKEFKRSLEKIAGGYSRYLLDSSKNTEKKKERKGELLVRFLKPIPKIVGVDLKNYGPFEVEDLASLPIDNADPLISKGTVVKVNWNGEAFDERSD